MFPTTNVVVAVAAIKNNATGTSDRGLYLLDSYDGNAFHSRQPVGSPWYQAPVAAGVTGERDASMIRRSSDGRYFVAYGNTAAAADANSSWGLAYTDDLAVSPTFLANVSMAAISGVNRVWGPEFFYDRLAGTYHALVLCSTSGPLGPFTFYEQHPTNADWSTWSAPVAITGTGLPSDFLDATIIEIDGTYHLLINKTEDDLATPQYLWHYTSSSPFSGYVKVNGSDDWAGFGTEKEGQTVVPLGDDRFRMYLDNWPNFRLMLTETTDPTLASGWSAPRELTVAPSPGGGKYWFHLGPLSRG